MFAPKSIFAAAAAIVATTGLIAASSSAQAREFVSNGRTAQASYADLDLSSAAGKAELDRRIVRAASKVCVETSLVAEQACRSAAIENARQPAAYVVAQADTGVQTASAGSIQVGN